MGATFCKVRHPVLSVLRCNLSTSPAMSLTYPHLHRTLMIDLSPDHPLLHETFATALRHCKEVSRVNPLLRHEFQVVVTDHYRKQLGHLKVCQLLAWTLVVPSAKLPHLSSRSAEVTRQLWTHRYPAFLHQFVRLQPPFRHPLIDVFTPYCGIMVQSPGGDTKNGL